jgi:D-amino-acid dehydrogenase
VRELEPNLAPIFARGVLSHEWAIVTDPLEVVTGLFQAGQARGVVHERARVDSVRPQGDLVTVISNGAPRTYDAALVTAGVWSKALAEGLGEQLPVEAERGYNLTYPARPGLINRPLVLADRGVVATPLAPGLRLGGWTELGGIELPPNPSRWKKMREISDAVLPALESAPASEWMGHRPSVPDSVPVISRSGKTPAVFYAVGHGHYGLSQSAKTARMIGEIIGEAADTRYAAHSIGRFN